MNINIPDVWYALGRQVHQDFDYEHDDLMSGLRSVLQDLSAAQLKELRSFVLDIDCSKTTSNQLAQLWNKSGSYVVINGRSGKPFFEEFVDLVNSLD